MKLSLPSQGDGYTKCMNLLNFLCFAILFVGLLLLIWRVCPWIWLRIVLLIVDYILTSMVLFFCIRPLTLRFFDALRARLQQKKK